MTWSWETRIRRAEQLAVEYPASGEVLRFYRHVAHFQQGVYERLKLEGTGTPLPHSLEADCPRLFRLIQRIGPAPLAEKAGDLERGHSALVDVLTIGGRAADGPAGIADDLLFFARVLLQPYTESMAPRNRAAVNDSPARCPDCGELPQAAVLRGEGDGAKRSLLCSLCSREWEFRRIVCPLCGEEEPGRLPVYIASSFEHVRIEACDRCKIYIKSVDLTKNGLAVPCVDELATVPLNLWAEESGYNKLQRNILGL